MRVAVGMGCDRDTPLETVAAALDQALASAGLTRTEVAAMATIDKKGDETALLALAAELGLELRLYGAAELARVEVPNPSEVVRRYVGTPAVAEAAALLAAGATMEALVVEKHKLRGADGRNATVSIARIER